MNYALIKLEKATPWHFHFLLKCVLIISINKLIVWYKSVPRQKRFFRNHQQKSICILFDVSLYQILLKMLWPMAWRTSFPLKNSTIFVIAKTFKKWCSSLFMKWCSTHHYFWSFLSKYRKTLLTVHVLSQYHSNKSFLVYKKSYQASVSRILSMKPY